MAFRVTQGGLQVGHAPDEDVRVTQGGLQVGHAPDEDVRLTQGGLQIALLPSSGTAPDTPSCSIIEYGSSYITAESSDYSHPDDRGISDIEWQIDLSTGDFSNPVETILRSSVNITSPGVYRATFTGGDVLQPSTSYKIRVRHYSNQAVPSAWSTNCTQTTAAATQPDTPTVSLVDAAQDLVTIATSAYSHPDGQSSPGVWRITHATTQWQLTTSGDTTFSSPLYDVDDGVDLVQTTIVGLSAGTTYLVRARHRGDDGIFSAWSSTTQVVTDADPADSPNTPTVSTSAVSAFSWSGTTNAYSHPSATAHLSTDWQVSTNSGFTAIVHQSLFDETNLESYATNAVLSPSTAYWVRARWRDVDGDAGDWSTGVSFTTRPEPGWASFDQSVAVLSGTVNMGWTLEGEGFPDGSSTLLIEKSTNQGGSFSTIQDTSSLSYSWDTTLETDGVVILRATVKDSTGALGYASYQMFRVDNSGSGNPLFERYPGDGVSGLGADPIHPGQDGLDDPLWSWSAVNSSILAGWGYWWGSSAFILDAPSGALLSAYEGGLGASDTLGARGVKLMGIIKPGGVEGSFSWSRYWDQELHGVGFLLHASGRQDARTGDGTPVADATPFRGISVSWNSFILSAYGTCAEIGRGDAEMALQWKSPDTSNSSGTTWSFPGQFWGEVRACNNVRPINNMQMYIETTPSNVRSNGTHDLNVKVLMLGQGHVPSGDWDINYNISNVNFGCGTCGYYHNVTQWWGQPYAVGAGLSVETTEAVESCAPVPLVDITPCVPSDTQIQFTGTFTG